MMIVIGVWFDTLFKTYIIMIDYKQIDLKCQLAIITRIVFHYVAFIFIILRINRVHNVNKLEEELFKITTTGSIQGENGKRKGGAMTHKKTRKIM